jgi:Integrase core domain
MDNSGMNKLAYELHKPARKNFVRRKYILYGIGDLIQIDLVDMSKYSRQNKGYKFILTAIDCFSKLGFAEPLKNKSAAKVAPIMERIIKQHPIKNLQSDLGKEFYNSTFKTLMKKYNINHFSTHSILKASICERFNRTLKTNMFRQFTINNNFDWISILPQLIENYNNAKHRTIGMKPKDVSIKNEWSVSKVLNEPLKTRIIKPLLEGQTVRISNYKNIFAKSYLQNWSEQLYKIRKVQKTKPITYLIANFDTNEPILGTFYREELQPTKMTSFFRIDKVIKKKVDKLTGKNQYLVKYLNTDKRGWLDEGELREL